MLAEGMRVEMTKGYKGTKGTLLGRTGSRYALYLLELDNGIRLVAGPTAFRPMEEVPSKPRPSEAGGAP